MTVRPIKVGILRRDIRARLLSGDYTMVCLELCYGQGLGISSSVPQHVLAVRVSSAMINEGDCTESIHMMIRLAKTYDIRVHALITILGEDNDTDKLTRLSISVCSHLSRNSEHFTWIAKPDATCWGGRIRVLSGLQIALPCSIMF